MNGLVSLTFDDGLDVHLDHVIPRLDEHGFRGTFYIDLVSGCVPRRASEWRDAVADGHELGNHSLFHPASSCHAGVVTAGNAIERYTPARMRLELETANNFLQSLDGRDARSFAYPCGEHFLGRPGIVTKSLRHFGSFGARAAGYASRVGLDVGSTLFDYSQLAKELFVASRLVGLHRGSTIPALGDVARHGIPSASVKNGWTAQDLIAYSERGLREGKWVVLTFHGVGGGHALDCDLHAFDGFLSYLADLSEPIVRPLIEAAQLIWPAANAVAAHSDDNDQAKHIVCDGIRA